jgi:hypothetical protein
MMLVSACTLLHSSHTQLVHCSASKLPLNLTQAVALLLVVVLLLRRVAQRSPFLVARLLGLPWPLLLLPPL